MTKFLEMFPSCKVLEDSCGGLQNAYVTEAQVDEEEMTLTLNIHFDTMPAPADLTILSQHIKEDYGLTGVGINPDYTRTARASSSATDPGSNGGKSPAGKVIYGHEIKTKPVPMSTLTAESGKVTVEGDVVALTNRELQRRGGAVLSFDLTDTTGTFKVSKFFSRDDDRSVFDKIAEGDHLTVSGQISFDKYAEDITIEPRSIAKGKKYVRPDNAPEKRVELHLHTRFSALDALTDPAKAVERAAYWNMPAIAVTDHGVAQAFPDMWKAGKKYGVKIIYGMEAYYVNDMDGNRAVHGKSSLPYDGDFVAFDIETTGLNAINDRITEIGAVLFSHGEIKETFNTFADPEMPIPADITDLTGIKDSDVSGAPKEEQALKMFMDFAKGRPLVAHNASFDVGFMTAAAKRHGIRFSYVYIDTLALSRALLQDLKRHKLDTVASHLNLPKFNHHRASDDALVCGQIMLRFLPMLKSLGVRTIDDIGEAVTRLKPSDSSKTYHMILLVQNKKGLKNLYEMISESYLKYYHRMPTVPKSVLSQHREGILVGSACGMGELYGAVMRGEDDEHLKRIASTYDYLEVQPICNNGFLVDNGRVSDVSVLQDYNRRIIDLGHKMGKPVVATCDVHFLDPEDEQYRKILQNAKKFDDADRDCPIYFRNTEEMLAEFAYLDEATAKEIVIDNPLRIAETVEEIELLPKDLFPPKIENSAEDLKDLVYGRMHEIYGENPPDIVKKRVETELSTILEHNYDVIYMSAQKLVKNSLENGYLVGSRGSVGSSIVAFMAGITEVNSLPPHYVCRKCKYSEFPGNSSCGCGADMPEKLCPVCGEPLYRDGFDIPFETFLGFPGNEKTPDIDLNFSGEYQAKAHKYTETLFGSDHVFRAGTIGTLAEKTAYGYVKKYLEDHNMQTTKADENRLALGLVGIKRTTGQHPGGLVIIPQDKDVTDFCPVQHPADDPDSGIITTHFEYHCMEDNLLKLDELGHDDPTMIRMLEDMTGENAREISLSDPETMSIFTSPSVLGLPEDDPIIGKTGTIGIPEFGTGFTRQMLVDTRPDKFDTLIRLSGFSHGTDVWAGNIRDLIVNKIATVNETVGCRDDIMLYLISKGIEPALAFKTMEAVRKGKVKKTGKFPSDAEQMMRTAGVPDWYIESCRKIAYLFPKAHAVAYVMMAFRIAWFKVHYPLAFYSAYFYRRSQKDGFDALMMTGGAESVRRKINELRRKTDITKKEEDLLVTLEAVYEFNLRGFSFAPIDLYKSDPNRFLIVGEDRLRPPFISISGLGGAAAEDLARAREGGRKFISVEELSSLCPKLSSTHVQILKDIGALGELPETSQITLFDF